MIGHDCPGLYRCYRHPRWYVERSRLFGMRRVWRVHRPGDVLVKSFETYAEAIAVATQLAREEATR